MDPIFKSSPYSISEPYPEPLMTISRRSAAIGAVSLLAGTSVGSASRAQHADFFGIGDGLEDLRLASDAYIYGYPLVTMEMPRRVMTNVPGLQGTRGPMGSLIKLRQYPDPAFKDVT